MKKLIVLSLILTLFPFNAWAALTGNSNSTKLVAASSQSWSITDGSQTGLDFSTAFTFCGRVKFNTLPTSGNSMLLFTKLETTPATSFAYQINLQENGDSTFSIFTNLSSTGSNLPNTSVLWSTPVANTWYQICVTYNAGATDTYINASEIGTQQTNTVTSIFNSTATFFIGKRDDGAGSNFLNGQVDDLRAWSRALSSTEISNLYNSPCTFANGANVVSDWLFDNNGNDSVGSNNLTNNNTATFVTDVAYSCASFTPDRMFPY